MDKTICRHCGAEMKKVAMPPMSDWNVEYMMICLNDECSYYVRGWQWMATNYRVKASYRFRINPENGEEGPIPVGSPYDFKNQIID